MNNSYSLDAPVVHSQISSEFYAELEREVQNIITHVQKSCHETPPHEVEKNILTAYEFAKKAHHGEYRKSGEPFIAHPVYSTKELLVLKPCVIIIQACLLHDVLKNSHISLKEIEKQFGQEVSFIISGMEKVSNVKYKTSFGTDPHENSKVKMSVKQIENLRNMFLLMSKDIRVVVVKCAERIHNLKTLKYHKDPHKQKRIALESLNIYAPIADRLGIHEFKTLIEDLAFQELYEKEYTTITTELRIFTQKKDILTTEAKKIIKRIIPDYIPAEVSFRLKSPYSIYKKMQRKKYQQVLDLYDIFALRVITTKSSYCYEILGMIHAHFTPLPKRFKDYIGFPKTNGYKSIHTTVSGFFKDVHTQPTEIQIRTQKMHERAEIGIAAHFEYSESGQSKKVENSQWIKDLRDLLSQSKSGSFVDVIENGLLGDHIFVFTPTGEVKSLPKGSTSVDFAYMIHSDLGNHLSLARADGKVILPDHPLKNGQTIEIVTNKRYKPKLSWISSVKTQRAKEKIKSYLQKENREEIIEKGKEIFAHEYHRFTGKTLDKNLTLLNYIDGHALDQTQKDEYFIQIGNLSKTPQWLLRKLWKEGRISLLDPNLLYPDRKSLPKSHKKILSDADIHIYSTKVKAQKQLSQDPKNKNSHSYLQGHAQEGKNSQETQKQKGNSKQQAQNKHIFIGGGANIPYKLAGCCHPKYPDKIVGNSGKGGVITIHKLWCPTLKKVDIDRLHPAWWDGMHQEQLHFEVECVFRDGLGLIYRFTGILSAMELNIENLLFDKHEEYVVLSLEVSSLQQDYFLGDRLRERIINEMPELIECRYIRLLTDL